MRVPHLDLKAQYAALRCDLEPLLLGLCESQQFILGPEVEALEAEIAAYARSSHAVGCASGTDALLLALVACGVGPGHEVITSAFTFFASAGAAAFLGARPVFVDIEAESFNLDPERLERAITSRTRAIVPVDLFGQCADMTSILEIAARHGLPVIEDGAQSLGAEHRGRRAGEMAAITTFSFYPSKNLGAFGDGGMLAVPDAERARVLRQLRVHGESGRYLHERVGINSRLDALQAAVLRLKLRHLDAWTEARQRHAAAYTSCLASRGLAGRVRAPRSAPHATRHVFNQYTVRAEARDELREHMARRGVGTAVYYPLALHEQPCFRDLGARHGDFPQAERAATEVLSLPVYPELTAEQHAHVVDCVAEFYSGR